MSLNLYSIVSLYKIVLKFNLEPSMFDFIMSMIINFNIDNVDWHDSFRFETLQHADHYLLSSN